MAKTERLAAELGIPRAASSIEEVLDLPGLDLVSLAGPHAEHAPDAIAALAAGKHVVVDKPMAVNAADAAAMVARRSAAA